MISIFSARSLVNSLADQKTTETMKKILLATSLACCISPLFGSDKEKDESSKSNKSSTSDKGIFTAELPHNLIQNPGFENKTSKWALGKYNGGSGLFYTDTANTIAGRQSAIVITENNGRQYEDVQLFSFFSMVKKAQYEVSFKAKVNSVCPISISVSNGFETFYEAKFNLVPEKESYGPFVFNSKQDDSFSFFSFNLGKTNHRIILDEVKIRADHTKKEFDHLVSKSGINIHYNKDQNHISINSPTEAQGDLPIILYDEHKNVISTHKIYKGDKEANITLSNQLDKGTYELNVFTFTKYERFKLVVE